VVVKGKQLDGKRDRNRKVDRAAPCCLKGLHYSGELVIRRKREAVNGDEIEGKKDDRKKGARWNHSVISTRIYLVDDSP